MITCKKCGSGKLRLLSAYIVTRDGTRTGKMAVRCADCETRETLRVNGKKNRRVLLIRKKSRINGGAHASRNHSNG